MPRKTLIILPFVIAFSINLFGGNADKHTLISQADSLIKTENYDAAILKWNEIIEMNTLTIDERNLYQSKLHYTLGAKKSTESQYREAVDYFEKAVNDALKIKVENNVDFLNDLYTAYYHALAYSGNWQAAYTKAEKGFNYIEPFLKGKKRADYIYDLGYINDQLGNFAEAIQLYELSIDELKALEERNDFDIGLAYNNLSTNYKAMGFFSARLNSLLQAQKYWERSAKTIDNSYFITLYGNLLKVYIEYGDIGLAQNMLNKTDSIIDTIESPAIGQIVNQHRLHIILHIAKNEVDLAESRLDAFYTYFNSLNDVDKKQYYTHLLASIQSSADIQSATGQINLAEYYLNAGLKIARQYGNLYYQMSLNSEYSKIADQKKEPVSVIIDYLNTALAVNDKTPIGQENLMTLNLRKAHYYQLNAQPDSAKKYIEVALGYLKNFEGSSPLDLEIAHFDKQNSVYIIQAILNAADLYLSFYNLNQDRDEATTGLHLYELAAKIFESYYQKGSYNSALNRINREIKEGLFASLQILEIPLTGNLLELIEQNNSHTLRKEFEAKQQEYTLLPPDVLTRRNLLTARIASIAAAMEAYPDSMELATKKEEVQKEFYEVSDRIQAIDPQFDKIYSETLSISETQSKLEPGELIIQYIQGSEQFFAVLVSNANIELYSLGSRSAIDSLVTDYHHKIKSLDGDYGMLSVACYQTLVFPFQEMLKAHDKLIIIPEGKLSYMPFEALKPADSDIYFVQSHTIAYSPSLSLWNLTQSAAEQSYANEKKLIAAFAPVYTQAYYNDRRQASASNRLMDLKGATREAQLIAANFDGDFFTNDEASKWRFIEQTNNYQVYHLAMHTIYDDEKTKNSQLVFQNEEKLSFNELYSLHFPAKMVVLSACNTGIGRLQDGEGMQSLSQALSYSGVQSSVYSLWPVPDKETAEIMLLFYQKLKAGLPKSTALAEAKRVFIEDNPMHAHPYFWAGFVLQGNQNPIVNESTGTILWLVIGFGLLLCIGLVWRKLKLN